MSPGLRPTSPVAPPARAFFPGLRSRADLLALLFLAVHTGPIFNFFFFNVGFHTAHHLQPALHWSELPRLHAEKIAPHIDPRLVSPDLWRFYYAWFTRRGLPEERLAS